MAQMWTAIGIMATAFAAMIGFSYRAMIEQGKAITAQIAGLHGEVGAQMDGLRREMNARFDHLSTRMDKVESIDRGVHALSIKVMGGDRPSEN